MPVIIKKARRQILRMTDNSLVVLGEPRIISASGVVPGGGAKSISVDIPAGPLPGTYWILEYIDGVYADPGDVPPDIVLSGFSIVPAGQPAVNDPANTGTTLADLTNRGIFLLPNVAQESGGATYSYFIMSLVGLKIVIPYGYTVRSVINGPYNAATLLTAGGSLTMGGLVRVVSACNPCPPSPQVPL